MERQWSAAESGRTGSRRRLRRRWPGVSAGLSLEEARPAHAGPNRAGLDDQFGSLGGQARCCTGPSSSPHDYQVWRLSRKTGGGRLRRRHGLADSSHHFRWATGPS